MLFFQVMLVAGYAYAHLLVRFLEPRKQAIVHLALLVIALTQLPLSPEQSTQIAGSADPTLQILYLLAVTIGLPFLVLSATVPIVQTWASRASNIQNPYRLYALSNTASLLALLSYPFVVEPLLTRQTQTTVWSVIFAGFVAACAYCAVTSGFRNQQDRATDETPEVTKTGGATLLLWAFTLSHGRCIAAWSHQSPDQGPRVDTFPVGAATLRLPADIHHQFR